MISRRPFAMVAAIAATLVGLTSSTPASASPADKTSPTAPQTLTYTTPSTSSILLTWSKSTDNVGVVGYDLYQEPPTPAVRVNNTTTSLSVRVNNLVAGQTYKFYVQARDKAKNSSLPSPTITVTIGTTSPTEWTDCSGGYVGLTYDDGPTSGTAALVAELKKYNVKATWFDIGEEVAALPAAARSQATQGHVQNHTWDHASASGASTGTSPLTVAQLTQELSSTTTALTNAGVPAPTQIRPPYGDTSANLTTVESTLGLLEIGWTTDTEDWQNLPAATIAATALTAPLNGIVLMHDGRVNTVAAVAAIVNGLKASHRCPGQIVYSSTTQHAWEGWDYHSQAAAW